MTGFGRVVGTFLMYIGNVVVVASLVTFLLGVFSIVDLAEAWVAAAFVTFWAGMGIASIGAKLRKPRTRRVRSKGAATVRSESGSGTLVGIGYVTGSYRIKKLHGRWKPRYRFTVNEVPVILRHNSVTLGSDDEWKLNVSRRRAAVRSKGGSHLAEATRVGPGASRWVIGDGVMAFEATVVDTKQKYTFRGGNTRLSAHDRTRGQARYLTLCRSGDAPEPVASLHLSYEERGHRNSAFLEEWKNEGVLDGTMELSAPVSLAVAVLALRLALGRWVLLAPRTGTWKDYVGG